MYNGLSYYSDSPQFFTCNGVNQYAWRNNFINPPTSIFSIGVWVRFSDNVNDRYILAFGRDIGGATGGMALLAYGFNVVGDQLIFELGSGVGRVSSGIIPALNTWYHIFATADGANTRFYVNGILRNTSPQGAGAIASTPGFSVGSYCNGVGNPGVYFHSGNIAQVLVFNRSLSAADIQQNYDLSKARFGL
jgi:hypothetical protein